MEQNVHKSVTKSSFVSSDLDDPNGLQQYSYHDDAGNNQTTGNDFFNNMLGGMITPQI